MENFSKIKSKVYDLYYTFKSARGEWNDGYTQALLDVISIINQAENQQEKEEKYNKDKSLDIFDVKNFKNFYFDKKGFKK
jgi:hypothetical protein